MAVRGRVGHPSTIASSGKLPSYLTTQEDCQELQPVCGALSLHLQRAAASSHNLPSQLSAVLFLTLYSVLPLSPPQRTHIHLFLQKPFLQSVKKLWKSTKLSRIVLTTILPKLARCLVGASELIATAIRHLNSSISKIVLTKVHLTEMQPLLHLHQLLIAIAA
jgi:hypothetical protein